MTPLGTTYRGSGDIDTYAAALEDHASHMGMDAERDNQSAGQLVLHLTSHSSCLRTLITASPSRMRWTFEQDGSDSLITATIVVPGWYAGLIVLTSLAWPVGLWGGLRMAEAANTAAGVLLWGALLFVSALAILLPAYLLDAYGGRRLHHYWEVLQREAHRHGALLQQTSSPWHSGDIRRLLLYLAYALAMGIAVIVVLFGNDAFGVVRDFPPILVLVALAAVCCILLPWLMANRPAGLRSYLVLPGLWSLMAGISLVLAPLPWVIASWHSEEDYAALRTAVAVMHGADPPVALSPEELQGLGNTVRMLFSLLAVGVCFSCVVLILSIAFWYRSARLAGTLRTSLTRLKAFAGVDHVRAVVSGQGFMIVFRLLLGLIWALGAGMVLLGTLAAASSALAAILGTHAPDILPGKRWVLVSEQLASLAISGTATNAGAVALVRCLWIGFGLLLIMPLTASIAQLFRCRTRLHRYLRRHVAGHHAEFRQPALAIGRLSRAGGIRAPQLVVTPDEEVNAFAHEFGWSRRRYVQVTRGAISALGTDTPAMAALLAHELSHFVKQHVLIMNALRWLARITLVGDSFAFAFADSFGYEKQADRIAVERFPIALSSLLICLYVLEAQVLSWDMAHPRRLRWDDMIPAASDRDTDPWLQADSARSLSADWKVFMRQYTRPFGSAYWHPHLLERIAAVARIVDGNGGLRRGA